MQCPVDGETLVMTERSGVEIDYCPKCRGVWLDRGELDKIIDRNAGAPAASSGAAPATTAAAAHPSAAPDLHGEPRFDQRRDGQTGQRHGRKRESFLSDLFDF